MTKRAFPWIFLPTLLLVACGGTESVSDAPADAAADEPVVIYSGRNKSLIEPLLERYTGGRTEVRYADTAELAATLLEEGAATPCDLFLGQDAAALGALASRGLLRPLPADVRERIPARFAAPGGEWVGLSGRARVVVYNTERTKPEELPRTLEEVGDERFRGRFGVAPVNSSFQAHMAVYRATHGEEALKSLLEAMVENKPRRYPKNSAIVEAVIRGEIDWGLVNHYYLWRTLKENPDAPGANHFLAEGDSAANFINLAGVGVVRDRPAVLDLVRFLVSDEAQRYFAEETFEYPLAPGIEPAVELQPLDEQISGQLDFSAVSDSLEPTLQLISSTGLLQ